MTDGVLAQVEFLREEARRLWAEKATNERVNALEKDIQDVVKSVEALRDSISGLMRAILVACVVWALGSAGFLIGVLTLASGGKP